MGWVAIPLAVLGVAALSGGNSNQQYVQCDYSYGYSQQAAYAAPAHGYGGNYYGGSQQGYAAQYGQGYAGQYGQGYAGHYGQSYGAPAYGNNAYGNNAYAGHYGSRDAGRAATSPGRNGGDSNRRSATRRTESRMQEAEAPAGYGDRSEDQDFRDSSSEASSSRDYQASRSIDRDATSGARDSDVTVK